MWHALDPASRLTCRRLLTSLVLATLWSYALSPDAMLTGLATLCCGCGVIAVFFALVRRERFAGPGFGHWDEAAVLFGVQCMAQLLA